MRIFILVRRNMTNKVIDNSVTLSQKYDKSGEIQSAIKFTVPKEVTTGFYFIPKWAIGLVGIFSVFVLTVLFAAIFVVYNAPRPGLYQESCAGRSCIKNFGLVCANSTCQCPNGYLYIYNCTLKKAYAEKCNGNNYCHDNKNLLCLNGVCSCNSTQYWNNISCSNLVSYGKSCKIDSQCDNNLKLVCDTIHGICACSSAR